MQNLPDYLIFGLTMELSKINAWAIGVTFIFTGTLLMYFDGYKNSQIIDIVTYLLILLGWATLFGEATKRTAIDAPKISFKVDKAGWFKQRILKTIAYGILCSLIVGNIYYVNDMADEHQEQILANGLTKTAVAVIEHIEVRRGRYSTSYYAVFQYMAGNKLISHPWYETHEADFLVGDKYLIKYSVKHPELFEIENKLQ
ncbi:MAG: hypothetical protein ACHQHN_19285 [Sphingobacteriales bacterium]